MDRDMTHLPNYSGFLAGQKVRVTSGSSLGKIGTVVKIVYGKITACWSSYTISVQFPDQSLSTFYMEHLEHVSESVS